MKQLVAFMVLGLVSFVVAFTCPGNTIYDKHYLNFPTYGGERLITSGYGCPGQTYIASYTGIVSTITLRLGRGYECNSNQTLLLDVWTYGRVLISTSTPTFSVGCGYTNFFFNVEYNQTQGHKYFFGVRPGTFDPLTISMIRVDNFGTGWTQCQASTCYPNSPNPKEDCSSPYTYPFAISVCLPEAICSSPCQNGGLCVGSNTCQCPSEWTDSTCSTPVCSTACANGATCSAPNTCACTAGWTGPTCSTPICSPSCTNGGTCSAPNTCNCTAEWTGPTCSIATACASYPCQNGGTCIGTNACQCASSWTGPTCTTPVCSPSCVNGGTCSAPNTCTCTPEWTGPICNTTTACDSNPCQNGGTCIGTNTCQCTSSWTGPMCATPVCSTACSNGGMCSAPNTCTCAEGWTGPTCNSTQDFLHIRFPDYTSANISTLQSTSWWPVVGSSDFTILASIVVQNKVGGLPAGMIITKDVDYQAANQLRIQFNYNTNRLDFYFNQGSGTSTVTATHDIAGPTLAFNTQYHVAAVRKGASIKLYVSQGGTPAEYTNSNPPSVIINNSGSTAWSIGRRLTNTDLLLAGQITNARIYGVALNVASLKAAWGI